MRNKDVGLPCKEGPIGSDFRFNERLTYLSRRFSVFLLGFRWFSHQNSYLKTLKPRFSPWWHSFLPVTQFYDTIAAHNSHKTPQRNTLFCTYYALTWLAESIVQNTIYAPFFLLFLPPLPLLLSKFSYSAPSALRQKGITDAEARGIYMSSAGKN